MDRKAQKINNSKKFLKNAQEALLDEIERTTDAITELKDLTSKKTNTELLVALNNLQGEMAKQRTLEIQGFNIEKIKGDRGEKGDTIVGPKGLKGEDGKDGYTPQKGIDYFDGKNGKDGASADEKKIIEKIIKSIPIPKDGKDGKNGLDGKNGRSPKHEYKYGQLRFENPDGTWGEWINLREYASFGGKTLHRGGASFVDDETPSGTPNGVLTTFTLAKIPIDGSLKLFVNGARMRVTEDYTLSSQTITFITAPPTGSILIADYRPQ